MLMLAGEEAELGRARPRPFLAWKDKIFTHRCCDWLPCRPARRRGTPSQAAFVLSPSKQTFGFRQEKLNTKPWSRFEKYTLERLILSAKGLAYREGSTNLVAINENVKSINSLNEELASLRKEHLESISKASVEAHTVHQGTIQDQKRFREITETRKEIIGLHNENLKLINRIYDQIDEYLEGIDEEIKTCQDKYVKEINSGEQERNAQIIKEQNARRRQEKLMREKRKAEIEGLARLGTAWQILLRAKNYQRLLLQRDRHKRHPANRAKCKS